MAKVMGLRWRDGADLDVREHVDGRVTVNDQPCYVHVLTCLRDAIESR